jgi:benzoyl-CoA reductase/2-hydroxyglutaryl-CoA dehydratase subunit BcrC/BadD/HgdB
MSVFTDDIITYKSLLRLAYNFLNGNSYLKRQKFKERKKLISVALPFSDLIFASDGVPVFPIRMEKFDIHPYLSALNTAKSLFGWNWTTKLLSFVRKFDFLEILDTVLDDVIHTINEKYNELYELAIEDGLPSDFCYGITGLTGMFLSKAKNLDANLNFTIRCSAWNKYSESLDEYVPRQIWVDIPPRNLDNSIELLKDNISTAISDLEEVTGNIITDNSLKKQFRIANQVKRYYKTMLFELSTSDFYPCNPATFAEILALLGLSFQDYNSNAQRYLENISALVKEGRERIDKGIGMDVSDMPRILITPVFGGWEPQTHEILYELGARTIYADWEILNLLEEIDVSRDADPIESYAEFLFNATTYGIGYDQEALTDSYVETAKELDVDGIVFNQVFGCHSISNCYSRLRKKIRRKLEIPTTVINFHKIGENVEQVRTRLGAFIEMFQ